MTKGIEGAYEITPRAERWDAVADIIVGDLRIGKSIKIIIEDNPHSFTEAIQKFSNDLPDQNVLPIVQDGWQREEALHESHQPLPPIHGLIDKVFAKFTAANLLAMIMELVAVRGIDITPDLIINGHINTNNPVFMQISTALTEVMIDLFVTIPSSDLYAPAVPPIGEVMDRRHTFLSRLAEIFNATLPAEVIAVIQNVGYSNLLNEVPAMSLILDIDLGLLGRRIDLLALLESAHILVPTVRTVFWTDYPYLAEEIVGTMSEQGIKMSIGANVVNKSQPPQLVQALLDNQHWGRDEDDTAENGAVVES